MLINENIAKRKTRQHGWDVGKPFLFLIFLWLLVCLGSPVPAFAQVKCDETIRKVARQDILGYKQRGDRCEGMFTTQPVAGVFEPVSFIIGSFRFDWIKDVVLQVSAPDDVEDGVQVRAVPIPLNTYYRMDGRAPMSWPIADVLYPEGLTWENVGVYGWIPRGSKKTYVPLRVVQSGKTREAQPSVVLALRPVVNVESVFWRSAQVENNRCGQPTAWTKINNQEAESLFARGELVHIDLKDREKGPLCIEITAREQKTGRRNPMNIRVLNPTVE